VIAGRNNLPAVIRRLQPLGYHHEGDLGVPGREAFTYARIVRQAAIRPESQSGSFR
jgi:hypothetical protein